MSTIEFNEDPKVYARDREIIPWMMRPLAKRGIIKNRTQAVLVLFAIAVVFFSLSAMIVFRTIKNTTFPPNDIQRSTPTSHLL